MTWLQSRCECVISMGDMGDTCHSQISSTTLFFFFFVKIINVFDMRASCAYCVLDLGCCRGMCIWPVWELCSPSGGQLQKVPITICSPSNRMSGHSVSCLQKLSHMAKYLIQVSVMSKTSTVKVSVIQRVHQFPLGFPFNAVLK